MTHVTPQHPLPYDEFVARATADPGVAGLLLKDSCAHVGHAVPAERDHQGPHPDLCSRIEQPDGRQRTHAAPRDRSHEASGGPLEQCPQQGRLLRTESGHDALLLLFDR